MCVILCFQHWILKWNGKEQRDTCIVCHLTSSVLSSRWRSVYDHTNTCVSVKSTPLGKKDYLSISECRSKFSWDVPPKKLKHCSTLQCKGVLIKPGSNVMKTPNDLNGISTYWNKFWYSQADLWYSLQFPSITEKSLETDLSSSDILYYILNGIKVTTLQWHFPGHGDYFSAV